MNFVAAIFDGNLKTSDIFRSKINFDLLFIVLGY